ncbi:MAG: hypothetical protein ACLFRU_09015 [Paracoccaceae bacterium]
MPQFLPKMALAALLATGPAVAFADDRRAAHAQAGSTGYNDLAYQEYLAVRDQPVQYEAFTLVQPNVNWKYTAMFWASGLAGAAGTAANSVPVFVLAR